MRSDSNIRTRWRNAKTRERKDHTSSTSSSRVLTIMATSMLIMMFTGVGASGASRISTSTVTALDLFSHTSLAVTQTIGTPDASEPSGYGPPSASALAGYQLDYVNDFTGSTIPSGWGVYTEMAAGDPGSQWAANHVDVADGELQLNTFADPAYNNEFVNGGISQSGNPLLYGAYFVRSKVTAAGSTQVELLWPKSGDWPPEIDFDETGGGTTSSQATLHFTSANTQIHNQISEDMTQWHTWGVIWTPTSVTYTVDGTVWGEVDNAADVPTVPMVLDIQQQTWCSASTPYACPTYPDSTLVDWVAEYTTTGSVVPPTTTTTVGKNSPTPPGAPTTTTTLTSRGNISTTTTTMPKALLVNVRPFAPNSSALTEQLKGEIDNLAARIARRDLVQVTLTGYATSLTSPPETLALGKARATIVGRFLRARLAELKVKGVRISVLGAGGENTANANTPASLSAANRRVVALIR